MNRDAHDVCFLTHFHMPMSNDSSVLIIKPHAKESVLSFHIDAEPYKTIILKKGAHSCKELLPHIISGPNMIGISVATTS
jgi:hypothetical protein